MSVTSVSNADMIHKKSSFHHRKASKELEVLEAARYFSEYNEAAAATNFSAKFTQKVKKKDKGWIKGRISLDMPVKNILNLPHHSAYTVDQKPITKEKKYKQPSSPGGRLASFLNSLFSHSASKKKKSKSSVQSMEDEDESPSGVTSKRRISISHFRSSNSADTKLMYSSPGSGFRTPPPHVQTPTKSYKELLSFSKFNRHIKAAVAIPKPVLDDKRHKDPRCLDEKCKLRGEVLEKQKNLNNSEKDKSWMEKYVSEEKEFRKFNDTDDGAESDSSSDLFELQIYDLDYYSTGLPVYESTDIASIKRRNSISNGPL